MRVADLPTPLVYGAGAVIGLVGGAIAIRLAERLPSRYEITLLASGAKRTRRNAALVTLAVVLALGLAHVVLGHPSTQLGLAAFWLATNYALLVALLASSAVDVEHMILPNELTIGGALLALATAHFRNVGLVGSLVGATLGFLVAYVPHVVYKRLRGRSGQGFGDTKLLVMAGAWLGTEGALFVLFAGALQSILCGVIMRILRVEFAVPDSVQAEIAELRALAESGDPDAKALLEDDPMATDAESGLLTTRLPLGPFLALGCVEFVFLRHEILDLFQRYLAPS